MDPPVTVSAETPIENQSGITNQINTMESGDQVPVVESLPDWSCLLPELLEHTFQYLTVSEKCRAALVCGSWRDACYRKSVWKGIGVVCRSSTKEVCDVKAVMPSLVMRGILTVCMDGDMPLRSVASHFPKVRNLQLNVDCRVSGPEELVFLLSSLKHLTVLDLEKRNMVTTDIDVILIAESLGGLISLNLNQCTDITDMSLLAISRSLKILKRLHMAKCINITDDGIAFLCGCYPDIDTSPVPKLEFLLAGNCINLTDRAASFLANGQRGLKHVDLAYTGITSVGVKHLQKLPHLFELRLLPSPRLGDSAMLNLANMPRLRILTLTYGSVDDGMLAQLATCPLVCGIKWLSLRYCSGVSDVGMTSLGKMVKLCHLDLAFSHISDVGLANLAKGKPRITSLFINNCYGVSDEGMQHLSTMTNLSSLNVSKCHLISEKGLLCLGAGEARIATLDVTGLGCVNNKVLENIRQSLRHLSLLSSSPARLET